MPQLARHNLMSSLRNSVKRRTHKERAQPAARQQYGLLEKKKDYQLRARDYHRKEKALRELWRKAEDRNPDEFYFAMEHRRTKAGVDVGRSKANGHNQDELQHMKELDINFLQQRLQAEERGTERMRERLHLLGCAAPSNHVVFVDDEQSVRQLSAAQHFGTPAELLDRSYNRPTVEQLSARAATSASEPAQRTATQAKRRQAAVYRELSERTQRAGQLRQLAERLTLQRLVMGNGRKTKRRDGLRWKKERNK